MFRLRCLALATGLSLFLMPMITSGADEDKKQDKRRGGFGNPLESVGQLLSQRAIEKLNLTDEQKEKLGQLQKEFDEKNKDALAKIKEKATQVKETIDKAKEEKDRSAYGKISEQTKEIMEEGQKLRDDFGAKDKLNGILTDEQKKQLEELKNQRLPFGQGGFQRFGGGRGERPGQFLPPGVQEKLKLTDKQKEDIDKMQKELEEKIKGVLNDEQKKQLEEMKNAPAGGSTRRPAA